MDPGAAACRQLHQQILLRRRPTPRPAAQHVPGPAPDRSGSRHRRPGPSRPAAAWTASPVAGQPAPGRPAPAPPPPQVLVIRRSCPPTFPTSPARGEHVKHLCELLSDVPEIDDRSGAVVVSLVAGSRRPRQDNPRRARRAPAARPVPRRAALREPAGRERAAGRAGGRARQVPSRARRSRARRSRSARTSAPRFTAPGSNGRRMLIVLDDARDAAQVRPLLPGSASCGVLVTSRVTGCLIWPAARLVDLDVLDDDEARAPACPYRRGAAA